MSSLHASVRSKLKFVHYALSLMHSGGFCTQHWRLQRFCTVSRWDTCHIARLLDFHFWLYQPVMSTKISLLTSYNLVSLS